MIKTNVKTDRLELTDAPIQKTLTATSFISSKTQEHVYEKKLEFKQDIDVRGMRGDEAIQAVTYFIDAQGVFVAYYQGAMSAEILQQGINMLLEEL